MGNDPRHIWLSVKMFDGRVTDFDSSSTAHIIVMSAQLGAIYAMNATWNYRTTMVEAS